MPQNNIQTNQIVRGESSQQEKKRLEKEFILNKIKAAGAYSQDEVNQYQEGIDAAQKMNFIILFPCAIISDFADYIPVIGLIGKLIFLPIIWYSYYVTGTKSFGQDAKYQINASSFKTRLLIWFLGAGDLLPFIQYLPLTTISVFIIWRQIKTQTAQRQKEMEEWEQQKGAVMRKAKTYS